MGGTLGGPRQARAVLDVASGAGRHARFFAERNLAVVAVDRQPQSIPRVKFVQADLEDGSPWPFPASASAPSS